MIQVIGANCDQVDPLDWNQIRVPTNSKGLFEAQTFASALLAEGICSLFVEGGAQTFSHLINAKLADRLYLFVAPKLLGGASGINWLQFLSGNTLENCPKLSSRRVTTFGGDILIDGLFEFHP